MKQFIQITMNGEKKVVNLSYIYSIFANSKGGSTIITDNGGHLDVSESLNEICEALDEILC